MVNEEKKLSTGNHIEAGDIGLLEEAREKYSSGLLEEAERIFEHLSLQYQNNTEIINDYGVCLWESGKLEKAVIKFKEAVQLDPGYIEAGFNLREVYKVLGIDSHRPTPLAENVLKTSKCFNEKMSILDNYPLSLYLEPTRACNLKCIMCRQEAVESPYLSLNVVYKLIPYLPYIKIFTLNGWGESLVHKDFIEILKIIGKYSDPEAVIGFNTNALLLNEEKIDCIVSLGINHISISIDSPHKETYEKIRRGGSFDRLIKNLTQILEYKSHYNTDLPHLVFHMVIMECNAGEIAEYIKFANEFGVKDVMLSNVEKGSEEDDYTGIVTEGFGKHKNYIDVYMKSKELADKYGICLTGSAVNSFENLLDSADYEKHEIKNPYKNKMNNKTVLCPELYQAFRISAEGDVSACCRMPYSIVMGNLYDQSLEEIWNGDKYKEFRESFLKGSLYQRCKYCIERGLMPEKMF